MLRCKCFFALLAGALPLLASAACEPTPVEVETVAGSTHLFADTLPVLGHGVVPERFTAEVAVRGSYAYTTTWGARGGVRGNAVKVWDVTGPVPRLLDSMIVEGATTLGDVQI